MNAGVGRRTFITGSLAAVGASAIASSAAETPGAGKRDVYVLQIYSFKNPDMVKKADEYFQNALLPALKRAGAGPVGVLVESGKDGAVSSYHVLIPVASIEAAAMLPRTLDADAEYARAGEAFLKVTPKEPSYSNLETRIMLAAEFMPKLAVPEKKETRIFELRRYRSQSEPAFRKKLEMFATSELAIFKHVGLNPVFYGEMLAGTDMPNITYMLTFVDEEAKKKAWGAFGGDADWKKLSKTPGYTDGEIIAVGGIVSKTLKPTSYSEI